MTQFCSKIFKFTLVKSVLAASLNRRLRFASFELPSVLATVGAAFDCSLFEKCFRESIKLLKNKFSITPLKIVQFPPNA